MIYLNPFASGSNKGFARPHNRDIFSENSGKISSRIIYFSVNDTMSGLPNKRLISLHRELNG